MESSEDFHHGIITAVLTPVEDDGTPAHALLAAHCRDIFEKGGDGIVLLGTTGEGPSFSVNERMSILENLIGNGVPPSRIMVSTGVCALTETIELTTHALAQGVKNVLVLPPYYYKEVTDKAIQEWFARLILETKVHGEIRIYYYHFPKMTGLDIGVDCLASLHRSFPENFVGIKDSGGDLGHMMKIIEGIPGFKVYSGTERFLLEVTSQGGCGCISATANYTVGNTVEMFKKFKAGEQYQAEYQRMLKLRSSFEGFPFVAALKGIMGKTTGRREWSNMRLPNSSLTDEELGRILDMLMEAEE